MEISKAPPNVRVVCSCGNEIRPATAGFARREVVRGACRQCVFEFGPPVPDEEYAERRERVALAYDKVVGLHRLLTALCEVFGKGDCIHEELLQNDRFSEYVEPRQVGHYLSIRLLGLNSHECGYWWHRDHSTVSYSVARVDARVQTDPVAAARVDAVRQHYEGLSDVLDRGAFVHRYTAEHTAGGIAEL